MTSTTKEDHGFMTVQEVSKYLRVHPATMYRLVKERKIPVSRIGKHFRFRKRIIDEWLTYMEKNHDL